jgi:hypothetical protein
MDCSVLDESLGDVRFSTRANGMSIERPYLERLSTTIMGSASDFVCIVARFMNRR